MEDTLLALGCEFAHVFEQPESSFYYRVYDQGDGRAVRLIDDTFVDITSLIIDTGEGAEALAEKLHAELPSSTLDELRASFAQASGEDRDFALRGLTAANRGPKSMPLFDEVMAAARAEDPELRHTAVTCMGRLGWKELFPAALKLAEEDPDEQVRENAADICELIEQLAGGVIEDGPDEQDEQGPVDVRGAMAESTRASGEYVLVLNPSVGFKEADETLQGLGCEVGLVFGPPESDFYERIYEYGVLRPLRLKEDDLVQIKYISIEAGEGAEKMAEKVLHDLPSFSVQDLRKVLSRTGEAVRKFALRGLTAISEGPKAQPLFDEVMAAAQDEDADLRYTAALCMARLGWEEFRPMAAQLAEEDDDEDVRDYAKWVAEVLDELHG